MSRWSSRRRVRRTRCGAFKGSTKGDFYDRRECEGPIAEQIEDAYQFVLKNMRVGTRIVNSQRREVYELPRSAVREAICNAAFHRDYLEPSTYLWRSTTTVSRLRRRADS